MSQPQAPYHVPATPADLAAIETLLAEVTGNTSYGAVMRLVAEAPAALRLLLAEVRRLEVELAKCREK